MTRERRGRLWSAGRFAGVGVSAGLHGLVVAGLWLQPKPSPGPEGPVVVVQLLGRLPNAEVGTHDQAMDRSADKANRAADAAALSASASKPTRLPAAMSQAPPLALASAGATDANAPAHAAAAAMAMTGLEGQDELHYQDELLAHITRFRAYPDAARSSRLIGRVLIRFAMSREGRVLDVWVDRSSGQPVLDAAARDTVLRAQPLPPIPVGLPSVLTLSLPVDFSPPAAA